MSIIRHRFLMIAFIMTLLLLFDSLLAKILILIIAACCLLPFMKRHTFFVLIFLIFFIWFIQDDEKLMQSKTLRIDEIRSHYVIASNKDKKCILYNVDDVSLYDVIEVEGKFTRVSSNKNRNTFQFASYLKHKHINSSMYVKSYKTITRSKHVKAKLFNHINAIEDEEVKTYLLKVFYRINDEQQEYAYFIYASGLHISFLAAFISKRAKLNYHKLSIAISFLMLMLFPQAAYMYRILIFSLVSLLFKDYHSREQLGISMIVLFLIDSSIVYEISFIIPVAFRLIFLFDIVKVSNRLKQLLVLIPIQLYFFHECNLMALFCFPFYRIMNSIMFLLSICAIAIKGMYPVLTLLIHFQDASLNILSYSFRMIGKPFMLWMLLWVIFVILYITYKQSKHLLILGVLLIFQWNMKALTPFGEVSFIDVGQGDCILIREPFNGEVMLIDVAGKVNQNIPKAIIYPVLKAKGIKHIDKVLLTHDDYDHSGGLKDLKELIKIDRIIKEKEDIHLKYLHFNSYQSELANDENDKSLILFSCINGLNYLFMGDASIEVEKQFIDLYNQLDVDILKVGHHGSKTSSSLPFIHQIRPLVSVISSGRNNMYKHPHKEVLAILEKENSYVVNTQKQGSISIYFHQFFNIMINGDDSFTLLK